MENQLLKRIIAQKEIECLSIPDFNLSEIAPPVSFLNAISRQHGSNIRVIGECKKASPSSGLIRPRYNPFLIAKEYARMEAAAVSVLTDATFFQGSNTDIKAAKKANLPVLRKDFIISSRQIYEARFFGADAILLIVRLLEQDKLTEFLGIVKLLGMSALVEVHNETEMVAALAARASIIGINNRDLDSLEVDLTVTEKLAPRIRESAPETLIVSESGVENRKGFKRIDELVDAVLIGTAFMKSGDIPKTWDSIFS